MEINVKNNPKFLLKTNPVRWMIETGLLISISVILHYLSSLWSRSLWPQGGVIGVQFVPVIIAFYRLHFISSTLVAFLGLIIYASFAGFFVVNPWQLLLDYFSSLVYVPVAALGAYWFKNNNGSIWKLCLSISIFTLIALVINFIFATMSGILFFASAASPGQSAIIYSLIYNSTYIIPSYLLSFGIVLSGIKPLQKMFNIQNSRY